MSLRTSRLTVRPSEPTAGIGTRQRIIGLTVAWWSVAAGLLLTREPGAIAVAGSLAIGWSHLAGRCGLSHLGALTPRGKLPGQRSRWLVDVLVYVAAGALASIAVGIALGALGALIVPAGLHAVALALVLLLALVAAATELRVIRWRLPEPKRQTRREWGAMFRSPIPAALWGGGLGLTFATVFTFSGTWLVLAMPFALGQPAVGATILLAHWLGRAAPITAGPFLLDDAGHTLALLEDIEGTRVVFRASNIVGISLIALSLVMLVTEAIT